MFPRTRPRRLRGSAALRELTAETTLSCNDLIYPLFVKDGSREPIPSMPGQYRESLDSILTRAGEALESGLKAVMLFGIPESRDAMASGAYHDDGIVQRATRAIKEEYGDLMVITDVCMCQYNDSGHCGILKDGVIDNDASLPLLAEIALSHARAGADAVAPSDMMDGRVAAIRDALDRSGMHDKPIISYAAKYASAFYGPFRDACHSAPKSGDRKSYQMDCRNAREALKEVALDIEEGADVVMVKPALSYLDIIWRVREITTVPVMAYNVSGEYSMVKAAAAQGFADERALALEMLLSIRRAGADMIVTYFAPEVAEVL